MRICNKKHFVCLTCFMWASVIFREKCATLSFMETTPFMDNLNMYTM